MGKRYYCDYCDRSFADGAENRKKHLASFLHIKLKRAHYDSFKDPVTILAENKSKNPCRRFHQTGECDYGLSCKYSHLTAFDIQQLESQISAQQNASKVRTTPDFDSWLQSKVLKMKEVPSLASDSADPVLPPEVAKVPNLPPSLRPPSASEIIKAHREKLIAEWG